MLEPAAWAAAAKAAAARQRRRVVRVGHSEPAAGVAPRRVGAASTVVDCSLNQRPLEQIADLGAAGKGRALHGPEAASCTGSQWWAAAARKARSSQKGLITWDMKIPGILYILAQTNTALVAWLNLPIAHWPPRHLLSITCPRNGYMLRFQLKSTATSDAWWWYTKA